MCDNCRICNNVTRVTIVKFVHHVVCDYGRIRNTVLCVIIVEFVAPCRVWLSSNSLRRAMCDFCRIRNTVVCDYQLYSHMQIHIYIQHHNDTINKQTSEDLFKKICTFHFIVRVRKGLLKVCVWEGAGDGTELQYIDPHSYGRQRCVFLVLQGCSTGGPGAQLSVGWWLSLLHLISNFSGPQLIGGPEGFFGLAWLSLPHLVYNSDCLTSCLAWVI